MKILTKISGIKPWQCKLSRGPDYTRGLRQTLVFLACALGMLTTTSANATCSFTSGGFSTGAFSFGAVAIPANAAVGTVLASRANVLYNNLNPGQNYWCGANVPVTFSFQMSGKGTSAIYATNIPGIGIRIQTLAHTGYDIPDAYMPVSWAFAVSTPIYPNYWFFTFQLVATGPIDLSSSSTLSYDVNPWLQIQPVDGSAAPLAVSGLSVTAMLTTASCSVTTPSISVTLPQAYTGRLSAVGATTGATSLNLGLNCFPRTKVYLTLTDASNASNTSTTLSLAPGSSATGVGLQILNGSTPIAYGTDSSVAGNANQWFAGTAAGGPMTIPLTAQYVRTSGALTGGTVKGLATFTMSYQ